MRYVMVAVATFIFGGLLVILGVPRTIGALSMLPSGPVLRKIQFLEPVQPKDLKILIASQKRGLPWGESGRKWTDLGLAQLLMAEQTVSDASARQALIEDAIDSLKSGLSTTPANPFAWTRLAYAEILKAGPSQAAASALGMSLSTAPFEPRLLYVRLELSFRTWRYFQADDRGLVLKQIRYAWHKNRAKLVHLALRTNRVNLVRTALLRTPAELSDFEKRLRNRPS